jgi:FMN-dependent NADH-azoreductase
MKILHIDSSPRGERSHSRRLSRELVQALRATGGETDVIYRDLAKVPPPAIDGLWIAAAYTPDSQRTPEMKQALQLSDTLIDEVMSADVLIIGVPMINFGAPPSLKAWIDQIVRAGKTFSVPELEGLAKGKKAYLVMASGGDYAVGTEASQRDHVTPHLRTVLAFIGITEVSVLNVATTSGEAAYERTLKTAQAAIAASTSGLLAAA